jgi:signal transduction histidine kinase/FixJ family two-component response regulator
MMEQELRFLILEDNATDAELIERELRRAKISFISKRVETAEDFVRELGDFNPDLILSDYYLPSFDGSGALSIVTKGAFDIPFILVTGALGEERAVEILKSGATDYILKDRLSRLPHAVLRAIHEADAKAAKQRAEELLSASEANLRNIIEKNADGIFVVNHDGIVLFVNPAAEVLFGRTAETLLGRPYGFPIETGKTTDLEVLREGGEIRTAEMNAVETTWEGEHCYLASLRDVTEQKRVSKELEQTRQQQLRLKDEFLSHVSHELRSPLTAIHQFVTILLDGLAGDLNSEQREYLEIALKNVYQLRTMISDLLEITRAETGKLTIEPQCISIGRVVDEICSTFRKNASMKGVILTADVPNDLPFAYADPVRIKQILVNLIDNGIKFTQGNGTIVVRTRTFDQDPNFLYISVTDNGSGISPGDTKKIFDRLYQKENTISGSRKGLGLGLYICRELVLRHGGNIWVESGIGEGSTFFFTLPVFSLTKLITPILTPQNLARGSVALITIEVSFSKKKVLTETDENETALRKVATILSRCALPDMDVLLPRMIHGRSGNIFCMVASADQGGTEVLVRRIQSQLARGTDLSNLSLAYAVSSTLIEIPSMPFEHLVGHVVGKIENMLRAVVEKSDRMP